VLEKKVVLCFVISAFINCWLLVQRREVSSRKEHHRIEVEGLIEMRFEFCSFPVFSLLTERCHSFSVTDNALDLFFPLPSRVTPYAVHHPQWSKGNAAPQRPPSIHFWLL
jgi:hypothetical protein